MFYVDLNKNERESVRTKVYGLSLTNFGLNHKTCYNWHDNNNKKIASTINGEDGYDFSLMFVWCYV